MKVVFNNSLAQAGSMLICNCSSVTPKEPCACTTTLTTAGKSFITHPNASTVENHATRTS